MEAVAEWLPRAPKRWRVILGAAAAYYALRELAPKLFEKSISGDVCVITGGAGGIGRLMALRLAKEGCKVALLDINQEALNAVQKEVRALGVKCEAYICDVSKREEIYRVAKQVEGDFGRVDMLINNAGIVGGKKLLEADDNRIELTLKINTLALIYMTKAFLPGMLKRDHGHIVNIASSAGLVGVPGLVDYCASKYGAVGFDESLRMELRKLRSKVSTTCVCPSYIKTGMFEGAIMQPRIKALSGIVSFMMPLLEPDYVANQVITAVKRDQKLLVMPTMGYLSSVLKALLPVTVCENILDDLGVTNSMNDFKQTRPT